MKIDLDSIDLENFVMRPGTIAGEECYLVFPQHIGCKWNKRNLIFRSSIWNSEGELISASYKKFFNWGEQPDLAYTPFSLTANGGCDIMEKLDGSTLIISKYKGELIVRTRGTFDATILDNGYEIDVLKEKYPLAFKGIGDTWGHSRIFEWLSPTNRIVIKHDEVDMKLTGAIQHDDYSLVSQSTLDDMANTMGVPRPRRYDFGKVKDMLDAVADFKGVEGVCVYCNKGQDIRKVKGVEYLILHKMKSELDSIEKVLDLYLELGMPSYTDCYNHVCEKLDFEIAEQCKSDISKLCDAKVKVDAIISGFNKFIDKIKNYSTRKEQALHIQQAYGGAVNRCSMLFTLLDGKTLDKQQLKKLFFQSL